MRTSADVSAYTHTFPPVPNLAITAFGVVCPAPVKFTLLAVGRVSPHGYNVKYPGPVVFVAVTFNANPAATTSTTRHHRLTRPRIEQTSRIRQAVVDLTRQGDVDPRHGPQVGNLDRGRSFARGSTAVRPIGIPCRRMWSHQHAVRTRR